jgi:serine/threonine-protein kinase OSR1/STK39
VSAKDGVAVGKGKMFIGAVPDEWAMYRYDGRHKSMLYDSIWPSYNSDSLMDYTIGPPVGFGASSVVHSAIYHPSSSPTTVKSIPCTLKVIDLDILPQSALPLLTRETCLMSLSKHPNVLRVWVDRHKLYIAMRLMNKGSVGDVMRYAFGEGVEEEVVKCVLKQAFGGEGLK